MSDNEYLARTIDAQLAAGSPVVLVSIVEQKGSSPRHTGTKMVVGADGKSYGTIGGGLLEAQSLAESKTVLKDGQSKLKDFIFAGTAESTQEMLCGGTAKLLFDLVTLDQDNLGFFKKYRELAEKGDNFYALTTFREMDNGIELIGRSIYLRDGTLAGASFWSEEGLETLKSELRETSSTRLFSLEGLTIAADPVSRTKTLYCFGGGHVAQPTAHIAALVGFRVVVIDDRAEFANATCFPDADETIVVNDFTNALDKLAIDPDSFIVIVTHGHRHDRIVLEQALRTNAGYIGMIGSRRKWKIICSALLEEGFSKEDLARVHCPIGLDIKAETPEEIAVSIAAELVQEKARQMG